ncbi:MAG: phosphoenolpyruvate carboxylase, partial [Pseudomonadota bacterium]
LSFEDFRALWERRSLGVVFTGHPTFLMTDEMSELMVGLATSESSEETSELRGRLGGLASPPDRDVTLSQEHQAALRALDHAKSALSRFNAALIAHARRAFPDAWRTFRPRAVMLGDWVGYDMDGRTDIRWSNVILFRLREKLRQLARYEEALNDALGRCDEAGDLRVLLRRLRDRMRAASRHTSRSEEAFAVAIADQSSLAAAADGLTSEHPDRLLSLKETVSDLDAAIEMSCGGEAAGAALCESLMVLRAEMETLGLGAAQVHFRINADQLHNAIRRRPEFADDAPLHGRAAYARIDAMAQAVRAPAQINFATLMVEPTTAVRQFLTIAQISKHIDQDSSIRLLIAECEMPVTALAAVYFAKLFGVAERIDVSPLFENDAALTRAAQFFEALLATKSYRDVAEARGRVCVQTGFSDAGRFLGQIPAGLAIERLQGWLAAAMKKHGLTKLDALIFNTHGESMGRGAHPGSMGDRARYVFSPWARRRFAEVGVKPLHEMSIQGGDGFMLFGSRDMALASLSRLLEATYGPLPDEGPDEFYSDTNATLDFYQQFKQYQEDLLKEPAYHRVLTSIGLALLRTTGSRKLRRQFEVAGDNTTPLRRIRAIPHNAILQQLGYLANIAAGVGSAIGGETDRFAEFARTSSRSKMIFRTIAYAKRLSSINVMTAYGGVFDGAYWASRPYHGAEPERAEAYAYLARLLTGDDRHEAFTKLGTQLRIDSLMLQRLLNDVEQDVLPHPPVARARLDLMHAVRIALIQHLFILAARIPRFSTRNDISREDTMEMIFELRVTDAVQQLRNAFPSGAPAAEDYNVSEASNYDVQASMGYAELNANLIDPLEWTYDLILAVTIAIAHEYSAYG